MHISWWRHQIETFSVLLALCAGNSPVTGEFLSQRPVTRSFDVFFDLRLNKRLSKQSWGWWFETPSSSSWLHINGSIVGESHQVNTFRPRHNGRHSADNIFKCIFTNDNVWILLNISLTFVPKGQISNIPAFVQKMAWCRSSSKPLSEPVKVCLLSHILVTRPQWVNKSKRTY